MQTVETDQHNLVQGLTVRHSESVIWIRRFYFHSFI